MAEDDDLGAQAGEFALGTLDGGERHAFLRRLAREPMAVEAVRDWQERLAPLALALDPVEPPQALLARIEGSIAGIGARPVAANDNTLLRWRIATLAAGLVALVAAGLALRPAPVPQAAPAPVAVQPVSLTTGIAALSTGGSTPGLFVTYDQGTHRLKVVPVAIPADARHSFELWVIRGKAAPKPMGVIDTARGGVQGSRIAPTDDITLAVSREPLGGSPTGAPTGPVLYTGKLVTLPSS